MDGYYKQILRNLINVTEKPCEDGRVLITASIRVNGNTFRASEVVEKDLPWKAAEIWGLKEQVVDSLRDFTTKDSEVSRVFLDRSELERKHEKKYYVNTHE